MSDDAAPPVAVEVTTAAARVAVGVDCGGTNARAALVELANGRVVREVTEPVSRHEPELVADLVARIVSKVDPEGVREGVGVGFAGMLRGWTGIVENAPNFGWRDVNFRRLLRARLGPAVELYNDLNAIAYGEAQFGAGRNARNMLCVFVGTGVGGGLVVDGKLYVGASHVAGEIGHTKVSPGGRLCGCGSRGCVEAYVSGRNIAARAREELARPGATSLAIELAGGLISQVHAGHIDQAARNDDAYAQSLWREIAPLLGLVLANAVTLLNPSCVVMGGGVWEGAPDLRRRVVEHYNQLVNAPNGRAATVVDTVLGDTSGMLGAAALVASGVIDVGAPAQA